MNKKRILVVDDSYVYQRLLSDVINAHDDLEVVGVASNGKIALSMMNQLQPDLVTLDILMPEMDGIQTLIFLRKSWPSVKIIMVSSLTSGSSDVALDALALGASEAVAKPRSMAGSNNVRTDLTNDLLPKIEAACDLPPKRLPAQTSVSIDAPKAIKTSDKIVRRRSTAQGIDIVAIGVSTGGPNALARLLPNIPADIGVPIVIVQHMPAEFTAQLARQLDNASSLTVVEAQHGEKLRAGTVYIAPGNYHMVLDRIGADVIVTLNRNVPENSCRPAVDPLFRSIPPIYGNKCLGVIMTGMGADGLKGCEVLSAAGCPIIAQDKSTSIVYGMPKLIAMAGLAHKQLALDKMARAITGYVKGSPLGRSRTADNSDNFKQTTISGGCS
jgi:two-component system chemotaxis response regulator CheB